ncbi:MAG: hypothetical protein ACR2NG_01575 [Acidimicrobiia bacterium]
MARSEHNREAYRTLFGYVGAGLQAFAGLMIGISFPIAPTWVVGLLLVALVALSAWSWRAYQTNFMMPTFVGTAMAVVWMLVIGLGAMTLDWGP